MVNQTSVQIAGETLKPCDILSSEPINVPQRSNFISLEPMGAGSFYIEGLTSYVPRLAQAHCIPTQTLIVSRIFPFYNKTISEDSSSNHLYAFWKEETSALNGLSLSTINWVLAIENLTMRNDIEMLTMLPFYNVLSARHLVRRTKAWCAGCYEDWKNANTTIYDPLVWSLEILEVCPIHGCYLSERCPNHNCHRSLPVLEARSRSGFCPYCDTWLGIPNNQGSLSWLDLSKEDMIWQEWVKENLYELLASRRYVSEPLFKKNLASVIRQCIDVHGFGSRKELSKKLCISDPTLNNYLQESQNPQIGNLFELCFKLRLNPALLMQTEIDSIKYKPLRPINVAMLHRNSRDPRKPMDKSDIQAKLEEILSNNHEPFPSMHDVARHLGYDYQRLLRNFRELCLAISDRYKLQEEERGNQHRKEVCDEIRLITRQVYNQGYYPANTRVAKLLSKETNMRASWAKKAWRDTLVELGLK